jgi:hypothetical protein
MAFVIFSDLNFSFLYFPQGLCDCWEVEGKRWAATFVFKPKAATFVPRLVIPWFPVNMPAPAIAAPTTNLFFPCLEIIYI